MTQPGYNIARFYTSDQWKALNLEDTSVVSEDWKQAVEMFKARITERFFKPVDKLIDTQESCEDTNGFVVLAIDCLVIETLQGFRDGLKNHKGESKNLFTKFLRSWKLFIDALPQGLEPEVAAKDFYFDCRCALLHSGQTDGFIVGVTGPAFAFEGKGLHKINRTELHKELKAEFDRYLVELLKPASKEPRDKFLAKMNAIFTVE